MKVFSKLNKYLCSGTCYILLVFTQLKTNIHYRVIVFHFFPFLSADVTFLPEWVVLGPAFLHVANVFIFAKLSLS